MQCEDYNASELILVHKWPLVMLTTMNSDFKSAAEFFLSQCIVLLLCLKEDTYHTLFIVNNIHFGSAFNIWHNFEKCVFSNFSCLFMQVSKLTKQLFVPIGILLVKMYVCIRSDWNLHFFKSIYFKNCSDLSLQCTVKQCF